MNRAHQVLERLEGADTRTQGHLEHGLASLQRVPVLLAGEAQFVKRPARALVHELLAALAHRPAKIGKLSGRVFQEPLVVEQPIMRLDQQAHALVKLARVEPFHQSLKCAQPPRPLGQQRMLQRHAIGARSGRESPLQFAQQLHIHIQLADGAQSVGDPFQLALNLFEFARREQTGKKSQSDP